MFNYITCSQVVLLNVVHDEGEGFGLLTVVLDGNGGGSLNLSGTTLDVVLAVSKPFTKIVTAGDGHERDAVGLSKGSHELLVLGIVAVVSKDAEDSFLTVETFANFVEALNKT